MAARFALLPTARRFARGRDGVAAIEFGMVGPLFLALVLGTFDVGGLMLQSMLLDRSVDKAVRTVRVQGGVSAVVQDQFKDAVCGGMLLFSTGCAARLTVEMTVIKAASSFPSTGVTCVSRTAPKPTVTYNSGARSEMVLARACLNVDPLMPFLGTGLGLPRNASGGFDVVATSGFMNEP
ncbi:TadE/TadG family type IV pilus assembly protein [Chenggangzhangella methanolivorans]|uniref:Pilus assembly protein n=1 Tax=Chenggangzhangella methanolivorans TaxID=1437009 RepID=A0A9E6UH45_9HYPH|nr:TadE/TadG family type IV pilus assembly protein [Chenggangzhangella methanolivorans]QZN99402.1 pilus assembly protein [Chenggangzhangella methanolivorans]